MLSVLQITHSNNHIELGDILTRSMQSTEMTTVEQESDLIHKTHPIPRSWGVYCEDCEESLPCCNATTL